MKKSIIYLLSILCIVACKTESNTGVAQSNSNKITTKSGYDLEFHINQAKQKSQPGQYAHFMIDVLNDKDSVLQTVRNAPELPVAQIPPAGSLPPASNPVMEAVAMMGIGDSMSVYIPADSLPAMIPGMEGSEYVKYNLVIKDLLSQEEQDKKEEAAKQAAEEETAALKARKEEVSDLLGKHLLEYTSGKLDSDMTVDDNGLKVYMIEEGTGPLAKPGQLVETHYYGCLLNGRAFDNSFQHGKPYPVQLGTNGVIQGWELGLRKMREGSKAILVIPHELGYGVRGNPPTIPEEAVLVFYIEIGNIYY